MRSIVALLLLAFWSAASSHALLQHSGLIHQIHADHDEDAGGPDEQHDNDHDVADGHCLLSPSDVNVPLPPAVETPLWACLLAFGWEPELSAQPYPSGLAPPGSAPPELMHRWQFSSRAALPVRAPSFVS